MKTNMCYMLSLADKRCLYFFSLLALLFLFAIGSVFAQSDQYCQTSSINERIDTHGGGAVIQSYQTDSEHVSQVFSYVRPRSRIEATAVFEIEDGEASMTGGALFFGAVSAGVGIEVYVDDDPEPVCRKLKTLAGTETAFLPGERDEGAIDGTHSVTCDLKLFSKAQTVRVDAFSYVDNEVFGFGESSAWIEGSVTDLSVCAPTVDGDGDGYSDERDCDDYDSEIHPGAGEICGDGVDNNCDGEIDDAGEEVRWFRDLDQDSYGSSEHTSNACELPEGYVSNDLDCNDDSGMIGVCNTPLESERYEDEDMPVSVFWDGGITFSGDTWVEQTRCSFDNPEDVSVTALPECYRIESSAHYEPPVHICIEYTLEELAGRDHEQLCILQCDSDASTECGPVNHCLPLWHEQMVAPTPESPGRVCGIAESLSAPTHEDGVPSPGIMSAKFSGQLLSARSAVAESESEKIFTIGVDTTDEDRDSVVNTRDNCPSSFNPSQADEDGDGVGNACDICPSVANPDQEDLDQNGVGDACEEVVNAPTSCCTTGPAGACTDDAVRSCVCDKDDICCNSQWDDICVYEVEAFGCSVCDESHNQLP